MESLERWSNLAEILGGAFVFVTLVYLIVEIRHNSRALRSATAHSASMSIQGWYQAIGTDPESSSLWLNGMAAPDKLSDEQMMQFVFLCHSVFQLKPP